MTISLPFYLTTFHATLVTHVDIYSCNRVHAGIGIGSEYLEYLLAPDAGNEVEELGDMCWYWALGWLAENGKYLFPMPLPLLVADIGLPAACAAYLDSIKRYAFYRKDDRDRTMVLTSLWSAIVAECERKNHDIGSVLFLNIKKLQEVRYPMGWTAAQAVSRDHASERAIFYAPRA